MDLGENEWWMDLRSRNRIYFEDLERNRVLVVREAVRAVGGVRRAQKFWGDWKGGEQSTVNFCRARGGRFM
jgi:hypothetical protein